MAGALHFAARRGDKGILQTLIIAGADVDVKSNNGKTILHEAAHGGSSKSIQQILGYGVDIDAKDDHDLTPLLAACSDINGSDDIVQVLLAAGANNSVVDIWGFSPLHSLAISGRTKAALMVLDTGKADLTLRTRRGRSVLELAAGTGDYELVRSLLARGASARSEPGSDPALHWAVRADKDDNLYAIVELLLEEGCDVNERNNDGCTPLHSLFKWNASKKNIVQLFLSWGADINMSDDDGDTVLNCLAQYSKAWESASRESLEMLLENHADASLANHEGLAPLHKLARSGLAAHVRILLEAGADPSVKDKHNRQPIQYAASTNEATVRALLDFGAEVNVTGSDWPSPIVDASSHASLQVLKLLLDGGADARSEDPGDPGWTALHAACNRRNPDSAFAELLIEHGADVNAVARVSKTTPLHNAVSSAAIVRLLLEEGALVDPQDSDGKTPLSRACSFDQSARVVEMLIKAGADPMIKDKAYGSTSLHYSCVSDEFAPIVIHSGRCDDLNVENDRGDTPLMIAARSRRAGGAVECLLQTGKVKLDHETSDGGNACIIAAQFGSIEVLKLLIEYDASIVLKADKRKNTALHMACSNGHLGVVKLLLETDASNIDVVNSANRTAFDLAAKGGYTNIVALMLKRDDVDHLHMSWHNYTPLMWAVWSGKQDLIEMLMAVEGTDLSMMTTGGNTLFAMAATVGLEDLCRNLIERGIVDLTQVYTTGEFSPLHYATESNRAGVVELLLAQPEVDKNIRSRRGSTPLWQAVRGENARSVMTLLAHHVDVDTPDGRGRTPLVMAVQKGNQEIVRLLLTAGAKAQLDEALETALAKRDKEVVQLLKDSGAVEHDEGFGLEELMTEWAYHVPAFEEVHAAAGAEAM
jgi:ankyrin repeat protein